MRRRRLWNDRVLVVSAIVYGVGVVIHAAELFAPDGALGAVHPFVDPLMVAATLFALAWGRKRVAGSERRFWDMLVAAWSCWMLVEVFFFFDLALPFVSASLAVDALHVLFYLILALAVDLQPHLGAKSSPRVARRRIESVAGLSAVFGVLIYFAIVVLPEPLGLSLSFVSRAQGLTTLLLVRLTLDLLLLGRLVSAGLASRGRWKRIYGLLATAMLLFAVKDGLAVLQSEGVQVGQGLLPTVFVSLPGFFVILAARYRHLPVAAAPQEVVPPDGDADPHFRISPLAIYPIVVPALHFLLYPLGLLEPASRAPREVFSLAYVLVLGSMVWFHQSLIVRDSRRARQALRQAESRLFRSQRLESVGRLAGGIAHDFNNYLTVIRGYVELLRERLHDPKDRSALGYVEDAADKATHLTRQLLAFGRRQVLRPEALRVNPVVRDTAKLLEALLGEDVKLRLDLDPDAGLIRADLGQTEQVLMNLALNGRDAMPGGGTLTVRTRRVTLGATEAAELELDPGTYVGLEVEDTGCGMTEQVRAQALEPFFTTKDTGKGTGLGLSTVYGIVAQSGGALSLDSAPGRGTTVRALLPTADEKTRSDPPEVPARRPESTSATILVVEDDEQVRSLTVSALAASGFRVYQASSGQEALDHIAELGPLDLLVTDVMMPGMDGVELAAAVADRRPEIRVLLVSGYPAETMLERQTALPSSIPLLEKPFTPTALVAKVREIVATTPAAR